MSRKKKKRAKCQKPLQQKGSQAFSGESLPRKIYAQLYYNGKRVNFTYQDKLSNTGKSGFFVHYMQNQQSGKFQ